MKTLFDAWLCGFGVGGAFGLMTGAAGGVFIGAFVVRAGRK